MWHRSDVLIFVDIFYICWYLLIFLVFYWQLEAIKSCNVTAAANISLPPLQFSFASHQRKSWKVENCKYLISHFHFFPNLVKALFFKKKVHFFLFIARSLFFTCVCIDKSIFVFHHLFVFVFVYIQTKKQIYICACICISIC